MNNSKAFLKSFFYILICALSIVFFSCKKEKSKPEVITFDYSYPDISFEVGDSATYGSTSGGWHYIMLEKFSNADFLNVISQKNIYSKDLSSVLLKSCTLKIVSSDSTFNMFDSVLVKIGGSFLYQGNFYASGYSDLLIAQLPSVVKNGSKEITVQSLQENCVDQIKIDPEIGFRVKLYAANPDYFYFPKITMKGNLSFTVTGTTH